jgi:hypothetical protein
MNQDQFRKVLDTVGISQAAMAELLGIDTHLAPLRPRRARIPDPVAIITNLLVVGTITVEQLKVTKR